MNDFIILPVLFKNFSMIFNCYAFKGGYKEVSNTYASIPCILDTDSQILLKINNVVTSVLPGKFMILVINVYKNISLKLQRFIHDVASCFENLNEKTTFAHLSLISVTAQRNSIYFSGI